MIRPVIHLLLHFLIPAIVARYAFSKQRWKAWFIMVLTMLIDLDHLLADPIYDPNRCSLGFHPLHSYPAIIVYMLLAARAETRVAGIGLLIHIILDGIDCLCMMTEN
jgi:hypothetical protein